MGAKCTVALLVLWVLTSGVFTRGVTSKRDYAESLCDVAGCNCTSTAGGWKTINCTFNSSQKVTIIPGMVPYNTIEISIMGGDEISVAAQSFYLLRGFTLLRIDGTKNLAIYKHAFENLNTTSLDLQVVNCNKLILENHAFKNMQTPIRVDVARCGHVSIQNSAFSRLQNAVFRYISNLELAEGAFTFENQGVIGRHGPVTNLSFYNVTIGKIPRSTFTSSLNEINFRNSEIQEIYPEAFKANHITSVLINTSVIHRMHSGALSGMSLIKYFVISKSTVHVLENHAIMAAINNLTVQWSTITEIKNAAIHSSATANIMISDNKISRLAAHGLIFNHWNQIAMDNNVIVHLSANFLEAPIDSDVIDFSFSGNEIWNVEKNAFTSIPELKEKIVHFKFNNNFFNQTCHCDISDWLSSLLNNTNSYYMLSSSFCTVNNFFSNCFQIPEGLINMKNFTELVCGPGDQIECEQYNGETKLIDTTSSILLEQEEDHSNFILAVTLVALLILAVLGTAVILLIKGGLWLKRKGYCVRFKYEQNGMSQEDEGAMVTEEPSEKYDAPGELSHELLQHLREQLENPDTHNEAREMIERLYEQFVVVDESYTNNNRQEEEAHLYEELGNMQSGNLENKTNDGIANYLKMMEDKLNIPLIDQDEYKPPLVTEYSEPTDAAVHLYSELKNKAEEEVEKNGSVKSHTSNGSKMAFRPLPEKPKDEAGPSSKY